MALKIFVDMSDEFERLLFDDDDDDDDAGPGFGLTSPAQSKIIPSHVNKLMANKKCILVLVSLLFVKYVLPGLMIFPWIVTLNLLFTVNWSSNEYIRMA
ncbi:MAG: hypothetical protein N0C90_03905 [Candidatus Thiodiazotropha endolucinida]|nr:hypothetical protein [Candidatus Thiodiazotropha taylori]MCG8045045.1 hypothetical protein [Candidatus Thiodiazotropha taylori]MCW4260489.1 hypothetical protein [Candidatus Thiodiazotropha endolucinida]MCW4342738.1 hypothetical protein [Candidatus Thiodiazotropha endolucinida]